MNRIIVVSAELMLYMDCCTIWLRRSCSPEGESFLQQYLPPGLTFVVLSGISLQLMDCTEYG